MSDAAPAAGGPTGATETEGAPLTRDRVLIVVGALLLGMFLAALDQTIVATALPTISGDLHDSSHYSWVITAYLLSSTVSTPLWGKLGDQYGRKHLFQIAIVIFLVGSALSGLSHTMTELVAFRFVQGFGGGGLVIGAQTILGDIVTPRERGRYMGLFMAMFGVTTVIGPFIGGLIVEYTSWRWIFYINLPIGLVALFVTAAVLPRLRPARRHVIDYQGTVTLMTGASLLILFTSLGGTTFAWSSPPEILMGVLGVAFLVAFVFAERRAVDPIMPLSLFANRVFVIASALGFVIGFAMFGAMTFVPLFFQIVRGVTPIASGIRLFPMMLGLLITSIVSGQLVSRIGRYKVFPIAGTALTTVGLVLMAHIGVTTNSWVMAAYMFIFGAGLGMVMGVIVLAVQNSVTYDTLGAATSNTTFFRMMGACFGTAVLGAVFANRIYANVRQALPRIPLPANIKGTLDNPATLHKLPAQIQAGVGAAFTHTIQDIFWLTVPVAALAFILSWFLPELPLRRTVQTPDPNQGLAQEAGHSSLDELGLAVTRVAAKENRATLYRTLAERAGLDLPPGATWLCYRLSDWPQDTLEAIADRLGVSPHILQPAVSALCEEGLVAESTGADGTHGLRLTDAGRVAVGKLLDARRAGLTELLEGWEPQTHPEVVAMIRRLAIDLMADDAHLLADAEATPAAAE